MVTKVITWSTKSRKPIEYPEFRKIDRIIVFMSRNNFNGFLHSASFLVYERYSKYPFNLVASYYDYLGGLQGIPTITKDNVWDIFSMLREKHHNPGELIELDLRDAAGPVYSQYIFPDSISDVNKLIRWFESEAGRYYSHKTEIIRIEYHTDTPEKKKSVSKTPKPKAKPEPKPAPKPEPSPKPAVTTKVKPATTKHTKTIRKVSEYDERKQTAAKYGGPKNPKKPSPARDAQRAAKPAGWRLSKSGKYYFENRSNRSDTLEEVNKVKKGRKCRK